MARTWQSTEMVRNISDDGCRRGMLDVDPPTKGQLVFSMDAAEDAAADTADAADADAAYDLNLAELRLLPLSEGEYSRIHYERYTPIHIAVARNDIPAMDSLLAAKADAEAITTHGWTPLMLSAMNQHTEACQTLKAHGVDERAKCRLGKTAEDYFPEQCAGACCSMLQCDEADYYETDYYGHNGYG